MWVSNFKNMDIPGMLRSMGVPGRIFRNTKHRSSPEALMLASQKKLSVSGLLNPRAAGFWNQATDRSIYSMDPVLICALSHLAMTVNLPTNTGLGEGDRIDGVSIYLGEHCRGLACASPASENGAEEKKGSMPPCPVCLGPPCFFSPMGMTGMELRGLFIHSLWWPVMGAPAPSPVPSKPLPLHFLFLPHCLCSKWQSCSGCCHSPREL